MIGMWSLFIQFGLQSWLCFQMRPSISEQAVSVRQSVGRSIGQLISKHMLGFDVCYYVAYLSLSIWDHGWLAAMMSDRKKRLRGNLTVSLVLSQRSDFVLSEVGCFKIVEDVVQLYVCCFICLYFFSLFVINILG